MDSQDLVFTKQSKRKRKLTQKFGALAPYERKSFCYWHYRERLKNFIFYLLLRFQEFVLWNNQSALQNEDVVTHTVKKLLKSGRIKEIRTPFYLVKLFYCRQKILLLSS